MPNWKKVITSGSNAVLNEITASGAISASTYYGDGSNLTGINTGSWDGIFTGSAEITGSLEVIGSTTINGNTIITGSNSLSGNYALKVVNSSGTDILFAENDNNVKVNGDFRVDSIAKNRAALSVNDSEIKFLLGDNANNNQAVTITRDGSTSTDVVALKVGSNLKIKRNGGGTPTFEVNNGGFIYQQNYNGNSITNSNPFNNGAGMGVRNTTQGSPVIMALLINGVFGAVNSAGSTLNICNPYGFANSTGTGLYTHTQTLLLRNTSTFELSYGPASGSNDVDLIRYQSNNTDSVTDYRHGLQLSAVPNAGASTNNGRGYATNGSNIIDMGTVGYIVRGFVKAGQSIYIHEGWTTSISNTSNPTRFTITDVDFVNETITLDSNWTGTTGNVSCWIEDTIVIIRNYDGNERFRFYGDGTLKLQSNLSASGAVSASTYYGDGSNLTGIDSGSWDGVFTGSAIITGSLEISNTLFTTISSSVSTGTTTLYTFTNYEATHAEYKIKNGSNLRTGTVIGCWDGSNVDYTETSINGLGTTSDASFAFTSTGQLQITTSNTYEVKITARAL